MSAKQIEVTYEFACPKCRRVTTEKQIFCSNIDDKAKLMTPINDVFNRSEAKCKSCGAPLPSGEPVWVSYKFQVA